MCSERIRERERSSIQPHRSKREYRSKREPCPYPTSQERPLYEGLRCFLGQIKCSPNTPSGASLIAFQLIMAGFLSESSRETTPITPVSNPSTTSLHLSTRIPLRQGITENRHSGARTPFLPEKDRPTTRPKIHQNRPSGTEYARCAKRAESESSRRINRTSTSGISHAWHVPCQLPLSLLGEMRNPLACLMPECVEF